VTELEAPEGARRQSPDGVAVRLAGVVHLYRRAGGDVVALRGVDLDIEPGEMVALLGPSGMGKSTVLRLMAGLIQASAGVVTVGERDLGRLSPSERRALRAGEISHIVQGTVPNVLLFATAIENIWFSQHAARTRGHVPPWEPEELLATLGLQEWANVRLAELPRGLQQQIAVVAGVGAGPRLLLADEPTSQLSQQASLNVIRLLQRIGSEFGTTVVIVTHDPTIAKMFPRTVTIRDGRVGAEGHRGHEYAVVDSSGSIQLPPDVWEVLPPNTRVRVVRRSDGVELRPAEDP
jgi:putative ABC transport system ATP-binding protein